MPKCTQPVSWLKSVAATSLRVDIYAKHGFPTVRSNHHLSNTRVRHFARHIGLTDRRPRNVAMLPRSVPVATDGQWSGMYCTYNSHPLFLSLSQGCFLRAPLFYFLSLCVTSETGYLISNISPSPSNSLNHPLQHKHPAVQLLLRPGLFLPSWLLSHHLHCLAPSQ